MIQELRTFMAVARIGTFSGAGERIGLTQSAVSGQIKRLEDSLGFALFERTGRSATLNAAGRTMLTRAEQVVGMFDRLRNLDDEAMSEATLSIGAISSLQPSLLTKSMKSFRRKYPRQRVRVVPGPSLFLLDQLDKGDIEAAVIIRPPFGLMSYLHWTPLLREPFFLAVHHSIKENDWRSLLQTRPFLRYENSSFAGRQVDHFLARQGLSVIESAELDEIPAMAKMVASGLGVALLPKVEAYSPFFSGVRMISLGAKTFYREIGLMQRVNHSSSHAVDHLTACIVKAARTRATSTGG